MKRSLLILLALTLTACGRSSADDTSISSASSRVQESISSQVSQSSESLAESIEESSLEESSAASQAESVSPTAGTPDLDSIPAYAGQPSVEINGNVPMFEQNEWTTDCFQNYFDLDSQGRVVLAYAALGPELLPEQERGDISSVRPTGFINNEYDFVDGGYLYNRCHLVAHCLSGQNDNPKNLMTGTRYMNVEGMQPYEMRVQNYIESTGNHVMYRVTPMFRNDEKVARGVLMEARSVEDDGRGIQFCVFCYNVQPGVAIDYATGENHADGTIPSGGAAAPVPVQEQTPPPAPIPAGMTYVLNTNTMKFHKPSCSSVEDIKPHNRQDVSMSRDGILGQGYVPCKRCHP